MNAKRLFLWGLSSVLVASVGLAAVTVVTDAHAKPKAEPAPPADPPVAKKAITSSFTSVSFGMSPSSLGTAIDRILDAEYVPLYKGVQPGVKMKELDDALAEEKDQFRRSRVDFGKLPTGYDAGPLRGEYTYNNRESVLTFGHKGETTYFFFIQDRLWKIIEEKKLSDASPVGKNYQDAVIKISTAYGVPGRVLQPDGIARASVEVDWKDSNTHVRIIQRSDTALAAAYEDNGTLANLSSLRANKPVQDNGIDPDVAASMRGPDKDLGPPAKKDPKKK